MVWLTLEVLCREPLSAEELERGAQLAKRYTQMMWKRNKLREQVSAMVQLAWYGTPRLSCYDVGVGVVVCS